MIRINLLGIPRQKKGKRASAAAASDFGGGGSGPSAAVLLLAGLVIGVIAAGAWMWKDKAAGTEIATQMEHEQQEGKRLADVKTRFDKRSEEAKAFEKRVKVIDQLRADQSGPVKLLNTVGGTVNSTDAVWLNSMSESGTKVDFEGMALSTHAVANLMTNLKNSGYFKSVEIKDATQDSQSKDVTQFVFHLSCEKIPPAASSSTAAPAQPKS
jgi:Tfp pilus assembly protein PilN